MGQIALSGQFECDAVVLPGTLLDAFLKEANEVQIKVYLFLMRKKNLENITVSTIADYFNYSEADVNRALHFWEARGVLSGTSKENRKEEKSTDGKVVTLPARPSYKAKDLAEFAKKQEISQLIFIAEQYTGNMLKSDDIASLLYINDSLGFTPELMEYLIEYCVSNNKKSMRYIETVANSWAECGIQTVEAARSHTMVVPKAVYEVFKAFGIADNRKPIETEVAYVRKWTDSYDFPMDIISEACSRTIMNIHNPSFAYADSILTGWHKAGVHFLADVEALDKEYAKARGAQSPAKEKSTASKEVSSDKVHGFTQRHYDYSQLEKEALGYGNK